LSQALEEALRSCSFANDYSRLNVVLRAKSSMPRLEWFALLGTQWAWCDNIWYWHLVLREWLREASREELDAMMEPAERAAWAGLPPRITVYRGCYEINRTGLSWSLDRAVAEKFLTYPRWRREGEQPLLLTGTVSRDSVVLKLDRDEQEIIAAQVRVTAPPLAYQFGICPKAATSL
jgi:hypothetical protein